jgi:DNA-binding NarL/FixJ family response regulator
MMQFLIVDDHPLYREALMSTLQLAFPGARIDEAHSIETALAALLERRGTDLILLDLSMTGVSGFEGMVSIRKRFPSIPILVVSGLDDPRVIHDSMAYGAAGFVPKAGDKSVLIKAIESVLSGSLAFPKLATYTSHAQARGTPIAERVQQLTPQQLRVLKMIRQGKLNKQIAHELLVGDSTVKAHVSEILRKLGVMSRTQIVIETAALNFDQPPAP